MSEFRVKWEYNYSGKTDDPADFYYYVKDILTARLVLDILSKYDYELELHDATGHIQFNHPTMGWVNVDDADSDDDLEGEAYLRQG